MGRTHLIIPDPHAHYKFNNDRAIWLGNLILDVRPDTLICLGDGADMPSLSSYDKGKRSFHGRTYKQDIEAWLDFQEKMWDKLYRSKKRKPEAYYLIGNHEDRITRAIDLTPELEGSIGLEDLDLERYYDHIIHYEGRTPGVAIVDGVAYSHYFVSGVAGRPTYGEHHAYTLISKNGMSSTQGHTHLLDFCERKTITGQRTYGLVAGVYQDYDAEWAGQSNRLWWRGVIIKRHVEDGGYDPQFISLEAMKNEYGRT